MSMDIGDFCHTLRTLEGLAAPEDICSKCVAHSSKTLSPSGTACGWFRKMFLGPFIFWGKTKEPFVVEKTRVVFKDLLRFAEHPESQPSELIKCVCTLTHEQNWTSRLEHARKILQCEEIPYEKIKIISSPFILESITAKAIPWDKLRSAFPKDALTFVDELDLGPWIKEVQRQADKISPELFLGVFLKVSSQINPKNSEEGKRRDALRLCLLLFEKFGEIFANDNLYKQKVKKEILPIVKALSKNISIKLSEKLHLEAYSHKQQEQCSVLVSDQPMVVGMIGEYSSLNPKQFPLPLLTIHEKTSDYLIVDRIVGTLDKVDWRKSDEEKKKLLDSLADIVERVLPLNQTPDLILHKFLITSESKIRLLDQLPVKHNDFFSICDVEQFINTACQSDPTLKAHVMETSGFFSSPYALVFQEVLALAKDIHLNISSNELNNQIDALSVRGDKDLYKNISLWLTSLSKKLQNAEKKLGRPIPIQTYVEAVIGLQKKLGFLSILPKNFSIEIVRTIKEQEAAQNQADPIPPSTQPITISGTVDKVEKRVGNAWCKAGSKILRIFNQA